MKYPDVDSSASFVVSMQGIKSLEGRGLPICPSVIEFCRDVISDRSSPPDENAMGLLAAVDF